MQEIMAGCVAREMSHPDHNVHLANVEEFYGYMDEFLSGLAPSAKGESSGA
jgi:2-succinyl-6-hydroxy-2,4-cyclohexadiene-1-carboxylate synthase